MGQCAWSTGAAKPEAVVERGREYRLVLFGKFDFFMAQPFLQRFANGIFLELVPLVGLVQAFEESMEIAVGAAMMEEVMDLIAIFRFEMIVRETQGQSAAQIQIALFRQFHPPRLGFDALLHGLQVVKAVGLVGMHLSGQQHRYVGNGVDVQDEIIRFGHAGFTEEVKDCFEIDHGSSSGFEFFRSLIVLPLAFFRVGGKGGRRLILLPWPDRLGGHSFAVERIDFRGHLKKITAADVFCKWPLASSIVCEFLCYWASTGFVDHALRTGFRRRAQRLADAGKDAFAGHHGCAELREIRRCRGDGERQRADLTAVAVENALPGRPGVPVLGRKGKVAVPGPRNSAILPRSREQSQS